MNELRESNNEEGVGESDNDRDDALDLKEGFKNSLMERQSEVDGTTIVGEDSGRLPTRTLVYWTPLTVKTHLVEPEFDTFDNPGKCSEFTFRPLFAKGGVIYKRHALPTGVMPLPQNSSGTRRINRWEFNYNDWDDGVVPHRTPVDDSKQFPPRAQRMSLQRCAAEVGSHQTQDGCARFSLFLPDFTSDVLC